MWIREEAKESVGRRPAGCKGGCYSGMVEVMRKLFAYGCRHDLQNAGKFNGNSNISDHFELLS
jgi:hypothetical protein